MDLAMRLYRFLAERKIARIARQEEAYERAHPGYMELVRDQAEREIADLCAAGTPKLKARVEVTAVAERIYKRGGPAALHRFFLRRARGG